MKPVIHLFGAAGSGTSTIGKRIAAQMGYLHMDTDDYHWLPVEPFFTHKRPIPERLMLMEDDIAASPGAVVSGALIPWGDPLIPLFTLCIRVDTPRDVRLARIKPREYARFGQRILPGGDMYLQHLDFLDWAALYDTGDVTVRSKALHDQWQKQLTCPVITVNGAAALETTMARLHNALYHPECLVTPEQEAI